MGQSSLADLGARNRLTTAKNYPVDSPHIRMPVRRYDMRGKIADSPAASVVTVSARRHQAIRSFEIVSSSP
jgi:hypothetical protein